MAIFIYQLNLPDGVKELIKEYAFFSKSEAHQRLRKRILLSHLKQCERWCYADNVFTSYYYKQLRKLVRFNHQSRWYSIEEYYIMHAGFCNVCCNYMYANTFIPHIIECNCTPHLMPDVD